MWYLVMYSKQTYYMTARCLCSHRELSGLWSRKKTFCTGFHPQGTCLVFDVFLLCIPFRQQPLFWISFSSGSHTLHVPICSSQFNVQLLVLGVSAIRTTFRLHFEVSQTAVSTLKLDKLDVTSNSHFIYRHSRTKNCCKLLPICF